MILIDNTGNILIVQGVMGLIQYSRRSTVASDAPGSLWPEQRLPARDPGVAAACEARPDIL